MGNVNQRKVIDNLFQHKSTEVHEYHSCDTLAHICSLAMWAGDQRRCTASGSVWCIIQIHIYYITHRSNMCYIPVS